MERYPIPGPGGGTPFPDLDGGYTILLVGVPHPWYSLPGPEKGYPLQTWEGVPPVSQMGVPPSNGGQSENITFCHPSDAGSNNKSLLTRQTLQVESCV